MILEVPSNLVFYYSMILCIKSTYIDVTVHMKLMYYKQIYSCLLIDLKFCMVSLSYLITLQQTSDLYFCSLLYTFSFCYLQNIFTLNAALSISYKTKFTIFFLHLRYQLYMLKITATVMKVNKSIVFNNF